MKGTLTSNTEFPFMGARGKKRIYSSLTLPISIAQSMPIRLSFSLKILWILTLLVIFSLFVVCIFQINAYTQEVFLIKKYEQGINQLTQENRALEINFSKVNSLDNLGGYVQNQVFEKANQVEYIRVLEDTALAR